MKRWPLFFFSHCQPNGCPSVNIENSQHTVINWVEKLRNLLKMVFHIYRTGSFCESLCIPELNMYFLGILLVSYILENSFLRRNCARQEILNLKNEYLTGGINIQLGE